jgi:hypothetical protein
MQLVEATAQLRRGVVGALVAVPAPVPQLAVVAGGGDHRSSELVLQRVEDDDDPRRAHALPERSNDPAPLAGGEAVADRRRQPPERSVGQARGVDGDDAARGEQVLGLVAQDEALERRGQQQHADRAVRARVARSHGRAG